MTFILRGPQCAGGFLNMEKANQHVKIATSLSENMVGYYTPKMRIGLVAFVLYSNDKYVNFVWLFRLLS